MYSALRNQRKGGLWSVQNLINPLASEKSSLVGSAVDKGSGDEDPGDEEDPKTEI